MFGISGLELIIICVFVLVIFGPDKLPELGRTIGRAMATFKRAQQDMEHVIRAEVYSSEKRGATAKAAANTSDSSDESQVAEKPAVTKAEEIWSVTDEADDEEDEE